MAAINPTTKLSKTSSNRPNQSIHPAIITPTSGLKQTLSQNKQAIDKYK
jgi:hypothetical protein